jgi:hypothetical protein
MLKRSLLRLQDSGKKLSKNGILAFKSHKSEEKESIFHNEVKVYYVNILKMLNNLKIDVSSGSGIPVTRILVLLLG